MPYIIHYDTLYYVYVIIVDGAIHRGAGRLLLDENIALHKNCATGEVKVAAGYRLPSDCEYVRQCRQRFSPPI